MVYEIRHNPTFDLKSSLDALNNLKNLYLITKLSHEHIQNYLSETREIAAKADIKEAVPSLLRSDIIKYK